MALERYPVVLYPAPNFELTGPEEIQKPLTHLASSEGIGRGVCLNTQHWINAESRCEIGIQHGIMKVFGHPPGMPLRVYFVFLCLRVDLMWGNIPSRFGMNL